MYARKLTREELMKNGITEVTPDGHVFKGTVEEIPVTNGQGYLMHTIYDEDENGNRIKVPNAKSVFGYIYKQRSIGLHRLMWAWFNGEVPEGMVVDHISNSHDKLEDYKLDNLQLLTPAENIAKERPASTKELKCHMKKPRSFYEDKLEKYLALYEQAKKDGDSKLVHRLRCNISNVRARLRYYDAHLDEATVKADVEANLKAEEEERRAYKRHRAAQIKQFKEELKILHSRFTNAKKKYGEDHELTLEARDKWKLGIEVSSMWIEQHPPVTIAEG